MGKRKRSGFSVTVQRVNGRWEAVLVQDKRAQRYMNNNCIGCASFQTCGVPRFKERAREEQYRDFCIVTDAETGNRLPVYIGADVRRRAANRRQLSESDWAEYKQEHRFDELYDLFGTYPAAEDNS